MRGKIIPKIMLEWNASGRKKVREQRMDGLRRSE